VRLVPPPPPAGAPFLFPPSHLTWPASVGSRKILLLPHLRMEAASLFWSLRDTCRIRRGRHSGRGGEGSRMWEEEGNVVEKVSLLGAFFE
jgi:hypothetical protein